MTRMITEDDVHRYFWSVALAHGKPVGVPASATASTCTALHSNTTTPVIRLEDPTSIQGQAITNGEPSRKKRKKRVKEPSEDMVVAGAGAGGISSLKETKIKKDKKKERRRPMAEAEDEPGASGRVDTGLPEREKKRKKGKKKDRPPSDDMTEADQAGQAPIETKKKKKRREEDSVPVPTPFEQEQIDEAEIDELLPSSPARYPSSSASPPPRPSISSKKRKRVSDSSTFDLGPFQAGHTPTRIPGVKGSGYKSRPGETRVIPRPQRDESKAPTPTPTLGSGLGKGKTLSAIPPHLVGTPLPPGNSSEGKRKAGSRWPTWATSTPDFLKKRRTQ